MNSSSIGRVRESKFRNQIDKNELLQRALDAIDLKEFTEHKLERFLRVNKSSLSGEIYNIVLNQQESILIQTVLNLNEGNQVQTANMLGINRNTLRKKIKTYNLHRCFEAK